MKRKDYSKSTCCANRIALSFVWQSFFENNFADFCDVEKKKKNKTKKQKDNKTTNNKQQTNKQTKTQHNKTK